MVSFLWSKIFSLSQSDVILPRHTSAHREKKNTDKLLAVKACHRAHVFYEELPSPVNRVFNVKKI
jgi:hypothetical protein